MTVPLPRLYDDLAGWWPLLSPPSEYEEEAADLLRRLGTGAASGPSTLLELGAGGGSLAYHLKRHFRLTLTDLAPGMLAVSKALNPECEHLLGDMRSLRLARLFDVVLVHDAIMYATDPAAVRATLHTAALHCRAGGTVAILPDHVRESFAPGTEHGGPDADGRGPRYLQWTWDPDPRDDTYLVDYAFSCVPPMERHRGVRPPRGGSLPSRPVVAVAGGNRAGHPERTRLVWTCDLPRHAARPRNDRQHRPMTRRSLE